MMFEIDLFRAYVNEISTGNTEFYDTYMDRFWSYIQTGNRRVCIDYLNWLHKHNIQYMIDVDASPRLQVWHHGSDRKNVWMTDKQFNYWEAVLYKLKIPDKKHAVLFKLTWL